MTSLHATAGIIDLLDMYSCKSSIIKFEQPIKSNDCKSNCFR